MAEASLLWVYFSAHSTSAPDCFLPAVVGLRFSRRRPRQVDKLGPVFERLGARCFMTSLADATKDLRKVFPSDKLVPVVDVARG